MQGSELLKNLVKMESRPWGFFYVFAENKNCTVKVLEVKKNECLSLQKHRSRDQLYFIIDPLTIVKVVHGERVVIDAKEGEMFYFKAGELHRAMNNTKKEFARYLEVSFGQYDEADIERVEDKYGRS